MGDEDLALEIIDLFNQLSKSINIGCAWII